MAGFLYYVPGDRKVGDFLAERAGVFGGLSVAQRGCVGPNGKDGALLIPQVAHPPDPRYQPGAQNWRQIPQRDWWIGYEKARRPGPDDLYRKDAIYSAHPVILDDQQTWLIPIARFLAGTTGLPMSLDLGADGKLTPVPMERFVSLWERAVAFWQRFMAAVEQRDEKGVPDRKSVV